MNFVDLGLPSGTLWTTCNIGAESPEKQGNYYSWGEIRTKSNYTLHSYLGDVERNLTKYCGNSNCGEGGYTDDLSALESIDDVASIQWGKQCRIPSMEQWEELYDNCTIKWVGKDNGKLSGCVVKSKSNSNSIFLPACGYIDIAIVKEKNIQGFYWSRDLFTDDPYQARCCIISKNGMAQSETPRNIGCNIRPIFI